MLTISLYHNFKSLADAKDFVVRAKKKGATSVRISQSTSVHGCKVKNWVVWYDSKSGSIWK